MHKIKYFFLSILLITSIIIPSGNQDDFETGVAVYCDLSAWYMDALDIAQHYHAGVFQYFEYLPNGTGRIWYSEMDGGLDWGDHSRSRNVTYNISTSSSNLNTLKNSFKTAFHGGESYHGAYSINNISADTRASIASTARALGTSSINYTWQDMLDVNDTWCGWWWCEDWNGEIYRIDELRCDGIVEYSYEKNEQIVSKIFYSDGSINTGRQNIATPDIENVNSHNTFHEGVHCCNELCPRIQAGKNHRGSGTERSNFDPLIALDPTISNFSRTQFSNKIQLNFKVADNASVKAYVLIQVKKTSESTWRTLLDQNNNKWQFKAVNLTDWNGSVQSDYFHIPWNGEYDGGKYSPGSYNFDIKITVIDQGANYKETSSSFSGNVIPASASVSPTSLWLGSVSGTTSVNDDFTITNTGGYVLDLTVHSNMSNLDLEPYYATGVQSTVYRTISCFNYAQVQYEGSITPPNNGYFTLPITIDDNSNNIHLTHTITGYKGTGGGGCGYKIAVSPENQIFEEAFEEYYSNKETKEKQSIRERVNFAYSLLKVSKTESVENICKLLVGEYCDNKPKISLYALDILWDVAYSDEVPNFNEKN